MISLLLLLFLCTACIADSSSQLKALRPCFERYPNHKLVGVKSYHSEFRMGTEEDCLLFCAQTATRCRSIVYDYPKHLCHFFLDDGAEEAEFAPRMIYFRVTSKQCLEDKLTVLPASPRGMTEKGTEDEKTYNSPVVAKKHGGKMTKKKTLDRVAGMPEYSSTSTTTTTRAPPTLEDMGIKQEAMDELMEDIEKNTERFEEEQRKEEKATGSTERKALRAIKEQIRKKLKAKIEQLKSSYPDMYEELMGGDGKKKDDDGEEEEDEEEDEEKEETEEKEVKELEMKSEKRRKTINDGEIERKKVARAPTKKIVKGPKRIANDEFEGTEDQVPVGPVDGGDDVKTNEKKFLAFPDDVLHELEVTPEVKEEKKSHVRKSPSSTSKNEKKSELTKNSLSKAQLFALKLGGGEATTAKPHTKTSPYTMGTRPSLRTRTTVHRRLITPSPHTTTFAPVPIPSIPDTEALPLPPTGCQDGELPVWIRFENSEADMPGPKATATMSSKDECEWACNEMDAVRSITYSEKDRQCQCNVNFDGISLKRATIDDFSVSTSTRFCFSKSLSVFQNCGHFMGFRDFTLNVPPREQFDGLPPSYEGLQLCIELCALSSDYACRSASFNFMSGQCSLNDVDSSSNPTDFSPILVDHLLYFENACEANGAVAPRGDVATTLHVNRVAASEVSPSITPGGRLKVQPIRRDSYTLKSVNFLKRL